MSSRGSGGAVNEARARFDEAERAVLLARLEADGSHKADGHASMYGLLRSALGWSDGECRTHMQIARLVDAYADAGEALFEAWASVANIASIVRAFANPRLWRGDRLGDRQHADRGGTGRARRLSPHPGTLAVVARPAHAEPPMPTSTAAHTSGSPARRAASPSRGPVDAARNREVYDKFCEAEFEADGHGPSSSSATRLARR